MISCRRIYGTAFAVLFQSGGRTMDIAIVTGASSGLGSEFARRLDEEGLDEIWVSARRRERLESLAAHLKTSARIVDGDVTDVTFIDRLRSMLKKGIYVTAICPYWVKDTEFVSTAKKYTDGFIKRLPFANHKTYVVSKALNDMKHGRSVSTPGLMATIDRYGSAVLPTGLIMRLSRLLMG